MLNYGIKGVPVYRRFQWLFVHMTPCKPFCLLSSLKNECLFPSPGSPRQETQSFFPPPAIRPLSLLIVFKILSRFHKFST